MRTAGDFLVVLFIVWLVCGAVASSVGPARYSGRLFVLTFLFMGPTGIAAALIMRAIQDFAPMPPAPPARAQVPPRKSASPIAAQRPQQAPEDPLAAKRDELMEADAAAARAEAEAKAARARVEELRRRGGRTDTQSGTQDTRRVEHALRDGPNHTGFRHLFRYRLNSVEQVGGRRAI